MKKISISAVVLSAFFLTACGGNSDGQVTTAASQNLQAESSVENGSTLVVYFSATGTTKAVAEKIAAVTGADTYEIKAAVE